MHRQAIVPKDMYAPTWQFSQAIEVTAADRMLFVSGIMGFRADGSMPESMVEQADQAYANLRSVLEAAGGTLADIVKVTVFVGDDYLANREAMRDVRARYFTQEPHPASTLIRVAGFAGESYRFEIEAIAALGPAPAAGDADERAHEEADR